MNIESAGALRDLAGLNTAFALNPMLRLLRSMPGFERIFHRSQLDDSA